MEHLSYIKTSQTWTCPKSGVYKIIAVGGGSGAAFASSTANTSGINGGTTSFGSYVSAAGGQAVTIVYPNKPPFGKGWYSGAGGYNLTQYGGGGECVGDSGYRPPTGNGGFMGGQGNGYGASGGFYTKETYGSYDAHIGNAGDIALAILDFTAGNKVSVTVGSGGTVPASTESVVNLAGRAGVVIVEYLGTFDLS